MAVNPAQFFNQTAVVTYRRRNVAALILRGLSQREIVSALTEKAILNPKTLSPWSTTTINKDVKVSALSGKRRRRRTSRSTRRGFWQSFRKSSGRPGQRGAIT